MPDRKEEQVDLHAAMEVCRPGSSDHLDPVLAPLAERLTADAALGEQFVRLQRLDTALQTAFRQVPVPAGLAATLLAAVEPSSPPVVTVQTPTVRRSRRHWLAVGSLAAAATAAALLLAVWLGMHRATADRPAAIWQASIDFFAADRPAGGKPLDAVVNNHFPLSRSIFRLPQTRCRSISGFLGTSGVAYDLPASVGARATLYVVDREAAGLPEQPPLSPAFSTAGCWTAAWRENGLLYVLVVDGGPRAYQGYLKDAAQGPLT
jgi:hypothetical protein